MTLILNIFPTYLILYSYRRFIITLAVDPDEPGSSQGFFCCLREVFFTSGFCICNKIKLILYIYMCYVSNIFHGCFTFRLNDRTVFFCVNIKIDR